MPVTLVLWPQVVKHAWKVDIIKHLVCLREEAHQLCGKDLILIASTAPPKLLGNLPAVALPWANHIQQLERPIVEHIFKPEPHMSRNALHIMLGFKSQLSMSSVTHSVLPNKLRALDPSMGQLPTSLRVLSAQPRMDRCPAMSHRSKRNHARPSSATSTASATPTAT